MPRFDFHSLNFWRFGLLYLIVFLNELEKYYYEDIFMY